MARITDEVQGTVRADAHVPPIRRHGHTRASYRVPTETRGRIEIGPMKTLVTDPFGLASSVRTSAPDTTLLVLPHVDVITPPPQPGGTTAWQMNDTALSKSLASRATSGQILISRDADDDTRLAFLQALREAGQTETSAGAPLTRIMAWVSEILLRPLVQPCFRISREASERSARPSGRMRKRR